MLHNRKCQEVMFQSISETVKRAVTIYCYMEQGKANRSHSVWYYVRHVLHLGVQERGKLVGGFFKEGFEETPSHIWKANLNTLMKSHTNMYD